MGTMGLDMGPLEEARQAQELFQRNALQVQSAQLDGVFTTLCEKLGVDPGSHDEDLFCSSSSSTAAELSCERSSFLSADAAGSATDMESLFAELDAIVQTS